MENDKFVAIRDFIIITGLTAGVSWVSFSTIFGIGQIWYYFNVEALHAFRNLLNETLCDTDAEKKTD